MRRMACFLLITLLLIPNDGWAFTKARSQASASQPRNTYGFDRERSFFVDYEIIGDEVKFRYSFHLINYSADRDYNISVSAAFADDDLAGWVESGLFIGKDEEGEMFFILERNSETDKVIEFTGKYLGGEVNTNLPFPEVLMLPLLLMATTPGPDADNAADRSDGYE